MAKLNLKFVKLFLVALELHVAVLFVGTLVFGNDDNLAWRTAEHSEKQRPICAGQDRVGPKSNISAMGSKADLCGAIVHVRFAPESGHVQRTTSCLLWAKSG